MPRFFNTAGPCKPDIHYILPAMRRLPTIRRLIDQQSYLVLHAPRQTQGVKADDFACGMAGHLLQWKARYPNAAAIQFDPVMTATGINERVIKPREAAVALLDRSPYLTRLHTALSPSEMTADPVFSFNPSLPSVAANHSATLETDCDTSRLLTADTDTEWPNGQRPQSADGLPASLRIERLRESGAPEVVTDNSAGLQGNAAGCAVGEARRHRGRLGTFLLVALALLAARAGSRRARRLR